MESDHLDIRDVAARSGIAASALRFYETQGLIIAARSKGNRRYFPRSVLRRLAFIRAAQAVGLELSAIKTALGQLPESRTPTANDWRRIASDWTPILDEKIEALTRLRGALTACIGCGCLSLSRCALYNPQDRARTNGAGPRYLLGDKPKPRSSATKSLK